MKKIFVLLLILSCWTATCGFTKVDTGAVLYSSGQVLELVSFKYDESTITDSNQSKEDFENYLSGLGTNIKTQISQLIYNEINNLEDYTPAQKENIKNNHISIGASVYPQNNEFSIYVIYSSMSIWNLFCGETIDSSTTLQKTNLFTKTYTTTMGIKQSKYTDNTEKRYLFDIVYNKVSNAINEKYGSTISLPSEFNYSYATSNKRIHSNSTSIAREVSTGLYYHTWTFDSTEDTSIELYQVYANTISWYILALGLTLIFAIILIIGSYKKQKDKIIIIKPEK